MNLRSTVIIILNEIEVEIKQYPELKDVLEILENKDKWFACDLKEIKINPHYKNITDIGLWKISKNPTNKELGFFQNLYLVEEMMRMVKKIRPDLKHIIDQLQECFDIYIPEIYKEKTDVN